MLELGQCAMRYFSSLCIGLSILLGATQALAEPALRLIPASSLPSIEVALTPGEVEQLQARKKLRLGITLDGYQPLELLQGSTLRGITIDYLTLIAKALGLKVEVRAYPGWQAALDGLRIGEVDLLGRGSFYEAKAPGLILSQPYVENRPVQVARNYDAVGLPPIAVVGSAAIAEGYLSIEQLRERFPDLSPHSYNSVREALHAVEYQQRDWFIGDALTAAYQMGKGELPNLRMQLIRGWEAPGYSFVFRRGDEALRALFDRVLSAIPEMVRANILVSWGATRSLGPDHRLTLTLEQQIWLESQPEVRVALGEALPPFSFFDGDGQLRGLAGDLLREISDRTGLRFRYVRESSMADIISALRTGKADMTLLLPATPEHQDVLQFTEPYIGVSQVVVGRESAPILQSLAQLDGKRLAVIREGVGVGRIRASNPGIQFVECGNHLDCLVAVAKGEADAALALLPVARYLIDQYFPEDLRIDFSLPRSPIELAFAVNKNHRDLFDVINQSVEQLEPGLVGGLVERWQADGAVESSVWHRYIGMIRWLSWAGAAGLLLLLVWGGYWYYARRRHLIDAESREMRSALLDGIPLAVAMRDLEGRFVLCNREFCERLNVQADAVVGSKISELPGLDAEYAKAEERYYFELLTKNRASVEDAHVMLNGAPAVIQRWGVPYKDSAARLAGLITGWIDITDKVHLMEQLQSARDQALQASEAKSTFLAVMSHEIRTPLNAIIGLLELAMRRVDQGGSWDREGIEVAYSSSNALLLLIGDILDLAKIESGKLSLEPAPCRPRDVLIAVIRVFEGVARQKGLYLQAEWLQDESHEVLLDAGRLKQVLSNLISNAIKFTDRGGVRVRFKAAMAAGHMQLMIEVVDSGIGISPEGQARLFEPFVQVSSKGAQRGGTGLGLVICRQLIEMMGGRLSLDSAIGQGTSARVELSAPLQESFSQQKDTATVEHSLPTKPLRVLLVDDHPANRLLLGQQLSFLGHDVQEAEDGQQAIQKLLSQTFDVLVTDVNMPVMDGYTLTRAVREREHDLELPPMRIVGFTANAQPEERERCLEAGMDDCLFKPVSLSVLKACLGEATEDQEYSAALFDMPMINSLAGGDQQLVTLLCEQLYSANEADLVQLDAELEAGRWCELGHLVHRIKGAARMVGAEPLIEAARRFEEAISVAADDQAIRAAAYAVRDATQALQAALMASIQP